MSTNDFGGMFTPYSRIKSLYDSNLFLFGDYRGSSVQLCNIEALKKSFGELHKDRLIELRGGNDETIKEHMSSENPPMVIIQRLAYETEQVLFNLPVIEKEYPQLFKQLMFMNDYPLLDEDLLHEVEDRLIGKAWENGVMDNILHLVFENSPDKMSVEFEDWKDRVLDKFMPNELLDMWLSENDDEDNYGRRYWSGYDYIQHETGGDVFFKTHENGDGDTKLSPPVLRMIRETTMSRGMKYTDFINTLKAQYGVEEGQDVSISSCSDSEKKFEGKIAKIANGEMEVVDSFSSGKTFHFDLNKLSEWHIKKVEKKSQEQSEETIHKKEPPRSQKLGR